MFPGYPGSCLKMKDEYMDVIIAFCFQRGLHKVVQPNHGAVMHKQWPMKQCRTAATYEYSEVEKTQDVDGDFDKYDISDVTQKKLRSKLLYSVYPLY
jgi:hypothetical protein